MPVRRVVVNGLSVALDESAGDGPPLVLLHGVARRGSDFAPLVPWLAPWRTIAWDLRGHGASDRAAGQYRVVDYAADVVAWLRGADVPPAVLYGHSLGALVAAWAAAEVPDRVRAIVLEDPPGPGFLAHLDATPYGPMFEVMERLAGRGGSVAPLAAELAATRLGPAADAPRLADVRDAASIRFSAACLQHVDREVFAPLRAGRWLDARAWLGSLARVCCPALLLRGEVARGGMLPEAEARELLAALPDATDVAFPGAGHLLHWQQTEAAVRAVLSFLHTL